MRLRRSLPLKLFVSTLAVLLLLLLAFSLVIRLSFDRIYFRQMMSDLTDALRAAAAAYAPGDETTVDPALHEYKLQTGSPVLVVRGDGTLGDRELFDELDVLTLSVAGEGTFQFPVGYLRAQKSALSTLLMRGRRVNIKAVRIGASAYYEPLALEVGGETHSNRASIRSFWVDGDTAQIEKNGTVQRLRYTTIDASAATARALLLYDTVKPGLILGEEPAAFLAGVGERELLTEGGESCRLLWIGRQIGGDTYYFVTVVPVVISGLESHYFNRYFLVLFLGFGLALAAAVYTLTCRFCAPLLRLGGIARKIAEQDFSQKAALPRADELGQLSRDVDRMSAKLEKALADLHESNRRLEEYARKAGTDEKRTRRLLDYMAHEFKTPLGLISAYTEALEAGVDPAARAQQYRTVYEEIERLTALVNETIQLSRLEAGLWTFAPAPVELSALIGDELARLEPMRARADVTAETFLTRAWVRADHDRLAQVLRNLLSNAIRYADGEKRLIVRLERADGTVTVCVENTGALTAEEQAQIWEPFYQGGRGRGGTGLGLGIVRGILEMHRSVYGVESGDGVVRFRFSLPELSEEEQDGS